MGPIGRRSHSQQRHLIRFSKRLRCTAIGTARGTARFRFERGRGALTEDAGVKKPWKTRVCDLLSTPARTRTLDPLIKSQLLYRLSYEGIDLLIDLSWANIVPVFGVPASAKTWGGFQGKLGIFYASELTGTPRIVDTLGFIVAKVDGVCVFRRCPSVTHHLQSVVVRTQGVE